MTAAPRDMRRIDVVWERDGMAGKEDDAKLHSAHLPP